MKLLCIILNYKTADMTIQSAESAVQAMAPFADEWQLVIVDNDSQDGSFETISAAVSAKTDAEWRNVSVVASGHNGGFGAGNNVAIKTALHQSIPPEYIYILNSDAFPEPKAIKELVDYLDLNPKTGIVGSYIHGTDGEPHCTAFRFPSILSELESSVRLGALTRVLKNHVVALGIPDTTTDVDWLAGASMMMRSSMLQQIGIFDETFFLYFEETDLCKRANNAGWLTTYVRPSRVAHIGSVSTGMKEWQRIPSYWLDSRQHYFRKNHGAVYAHIATATKILGEVIWKVRLKIQTKEDPSPPHFIKDLFKHWASTKQL